MRGQGKTAGELADCDFARLISPRGVAVIGFSDDGKGDATVLILER